MEGWQKLKDWRRDIIANPPVHQYPEAAQASQPVQPAEPTAEDSNVPVGPVKLQDALLKEDYGLKALPAKFKGVQFSREKGKEAEDIECMMKIYQHWLQDVANNAKLKNRSKIHTVDFANALGGFFTGNLHESVWHMRCDYKLVQSGANLSSKSTENAPQDKPDGASGTADEGKAAAGGKGITDEKRAEIAAKRKAALERLAAKRARTEEGAAHVEPAPAEAATGAVAPSPASKDEDAAAPEAAPGAAVAEAPVEAAAATPDAARKQAIAEKRRIAQERLAAARAKKAQEEKCEEKPATEQSQE